jgi:multiple sugar transport system permease protein
VSSKSASGGRQGTSARKRAVSSYRRHAFPYLLILPTLACMSIVLVYPTIRVVVMSFLRVDLLDPARSGVWVGLRNYVTILSRPDFWNALRITLIYAAGTLVGAYLFGLGTALMLNQRFVGRGLARVLVLLPWAIPFVAAAISFTWIYDAEYGVLNFLLLRSGLIAERVRWLTNPAVALRALILVSVWLQYPFVTMMMLAGLQTVSKDLYEAASIDGAGAWQRFWSVTLPGLSSVRSVVILLVTIWAFKQFTIVYTMTGGGPVRSTETLVIQTYRQAFTFYNMGLASTLGTITLLIVMLLTGVYFLILSRRGDGV